MTTTEALGFELPWEVHEMDKWLRDGNPTLGWRGDKRLSLGMGIITAPQTGWYHGKLHRAGDKIGWCWQVLRHNEDGTDTVILQRKGTELHTLIPKLIEMDPRTPGFENVMDRVEREDAIVQKHKTQDIADARGQAAEHLWALVAERQNGRSTVRQVGGSDERPDRNLARPHPGPRPGS